MPQPLDSDLLAGTEFDIPDMAPARPPQRRQPRLQQAQVVSLLTKLPQERLQLLDPFRNPLLAGR